jgi:hypothetical protein
MVVPNTAAAGIQVTGPYTNTSDATLKENIVTITGALSLISNLNGVYYDWIANPEMGRQIGLVAQEVQTVIPEVVSSSVVDGKLGISYSPIIAVLINAIKELKAEVDVLKKGN